MAGFMSACMTEESARGVGEQGDARVSVKLRKAASLGKAADIEMSELVLTVHAVDEDTLRDTIGISGNAQQTVSSTFESLASGKIWTLTAAAVDAEGVTIYGGAVNFTVPPGATQNVSLDLAAQYSMLKARFFPIRDSVTRLELRVDDELVASDTFPKQSLVGDTVVLAHDYLPASLPYGQPKTIKMEAYGEWEGEERLLYTGEKFINVVSGHDTSYAIALTWVGPPAPGAGSMTVTLGAVGTVWMNGFLDTLAANAWYFVGGPVSVAGGFKPVLRFNDSGVTYVAYDDAANDYKLTVRYWTGTAWAALGAPGFTPAEVPWFSMDIGPDGTPWVAFRDNSQDGKLSVMRYLSGSWVNVGSPGFAGGEVWESSIVFDGDGNPYVAYVDYGNEGRISAKHWTGSAWVNAGSGPLSAGESNTPSLAISASGTLYAAFIDAGVSFKARVLKLEGGDWSDVGSEGVTSEYAHFLNLQVKADGTPILAYGDYSQGLTVTVIEWSGSSWDVVGWPGFSTPADGVTMALDPDQNPYIAYREREGAAELRTTVMRWTGGDWQFVGPQGISGGVTAYPSLEIRDDGVPYAAFLDGYSGDNIRTMRYAPD
jgi:hypothetical protein